jgi:ATP-dependent Clp protease, protease subunit
MHSNDEFYKYATKHKGIGSLTLERYAKANQSVNNMTRSIIEEREVNFREVDVFSRLMMDRILFIGLPIDYAFANIIQAQLLFLDSADPTKDIQIYFNTLGGDVFGGLGIYDTMQYVSADVSTICTGIAASMGAVLLAAGRKGKRSALRHARLMIHQPTGTIGGQASNIEIYTSLVTDLKKDLYQILADHTNQSAKKIEKDADRDFWMDAKEAKKYGLIDEVLIKDKTDKK